MRAITEHEAADIAKAAVARFTEHGQIAARLEGLLVPQLTQAILAVPAGADQYGVRVANAMDDILEPHRRGYEKVKRRAAGK